MLWKHPEHSCTSSECVTSGKLFSEFTGNNLEIILFYKRGKKLRVFSLLNYYFSFPYSDACTVLCAGEEQITKKGCSV